MKFVLPLPLISFPTPLNFQNIVSFCLKYVCHKHHKAKFCCSFQSDKFASFNGKFQFNFSVTTDTVHFIPSVLLCFYYLI